MNNLTPRNTRQSGMTLIEVVLAMAILAIGAFTLIEATSRCLAALKMCRNYQVARTVLKQGELDYPLVWTNAPEDNEVQEAEYDNGFKFSRELEQCNDEESLYIVRTKVTWSERGQNATEEVEGLYYYRDEDTLGGAL